MKTPSYGASRHYVGQSGKDYFAWQNEHGAVRGRINARKFAPYIHGGQTVVDLGCGGGHVLAALDAERRIGVEINPAAREVASRHGIETHASLTEVGDALADVVISNHALEHMPYPIEALRQVRRVLKPMGTLVLVVPLDDWRVQRRWSEDDVNKHLHTWTPLLLGNSLREAGFRVREDTISIVAHAWPPMWHWLFTRSPGSFDITAQIWARVRRRRELIACVRRDTDTLDGE